MNCSIPTLKKNAVSSAVSSFIGNSTSFKEVRPGVIEMYVSSKFNINQLFKIAHSNSERVHKAMAVEFGPKNKYNWVHIDTSNRNLITVRINTPNTLIQSWNVKKGLQSLEEANANANLFERNLGYFRGDQALLEQEFQNDDDFYKELDDNFSNFGEQSNFDFSNEKYDGVKNWEHDSSKDKDVTLTDKQLEDIKRNQKFC